MLAPATVTSLRPLVSAGLVILLGCAVAISTALSLYLLLLAVASLRRTPRMPVPGAPVTRFAILIPAHEEELVIGSLLESIKVLDYPRELYTVDVVADHCSDHTAAVARELGARVYERNDPEPRGKSWSLNSLVRKLLRGEAGGFVDAFVVVDADSVMSPNFLRVMDARLGSGGTVIQSLVQIDDPGASGTGQLRGLAYEFISRVRPLGRSAIGLSAGLRGNGMCIARDVAGRFSWNTDSLTEDYELHGRLLMAGIRTAFAPEAVVLTQLPPSSASAHTQSQRWERGRLETMRSSVPPLLAHAFRTGSWSSIDGALELLVPPFSILVAVTIMLFGLSVLSGSRLLIVVALIGLVAQCVYTLRGLVPAAKRHPRIYGALFIAPIFVIRRLWLYLTVLTRRTRVQWTRTVRTPPS